MANVSRINGLRPVKHINGSPWNGQTNRYWIAAADGTATFVGDIVKLSGTADVDGTASVNQGTAGGTPVGVIVGMEPNPSDLTQNYRPASQNITNQNAGRWVSVCDAPDVIFEVQSNGTTSAVDVGLNGSPVVGAGSTTTGQSGMQWDDSTKNTTSTLILQLVGFVPRPDNEIGVASAKLLVRFNVHQYGSVGVAGV